MGLCDRRDRKWADGGLFRQVPGKQKKPGKPIISGFPGIDTKTAFQIGGLFLYLSPESPPYQAFRAFSVFRGLGGLVRHRPASYRGDHIVPWRLIFAHPCPARICQKRGNAKKYPLPDSATSFNENNLAGTLQLPLFLIPARKPLHNLRRLH